MSETTFNPDAKLQQAQQDKRRKQAVRWVDNILTWMLYVIIFVVFATPLLWALGNSFRINQDIWGNLFPVSLATFVPSPEQITINTYAEALGFGAEARGLSYNMGRAVVISLASAVLVVGMSLVFNTFAAYFFARLRVPGKRFLLLFVVLSMMIPQQITTIPLFFVVHELGLINTFWALVVPFYASPFIMFALTQFFAEVPYELDEAAIMDGANLLQILRHVVVPSAIPGLLTVSLLEFQLIWNNFYWPLVAVSDRSLFPVNVALAAHFTEQVPDWGRILAAAVIASLPVVVLFAALQRYYFESVTLSGLKG